MAQSPFSLRSRLASSLLRIWSHRGWASTALLPLAWLFAAVTRSRRALFDRGLRVASRVPVPVIVVGNIIVGGAGKTPAVLAIVALLQRHGYTPGIVSRGHGRANVEAIIVVEPDADATQVGDEPLLLRRKSGAPVAVGRDRVAAAHALLRARADVDIIVSDDGLQHLTLHRDLEVLVFDERGAGNGRLLPAGPLREALPARLGAGRIVLYNATQATTPLPGHVSQRTLAGIVPLADWWRGTPATLAGFDLIRGRTVLAVAGVARPERFFAMLRERGIAIETLAVEDHHDFTVLPWPTAAADVVLTEKDAVKIAPTRRLGTRVWVAALDFVPEAAFETALLALLPPRDVPSERIR